MGAKGGGAPGASQPQVIRQLRVQSSVYGNVIPVVFGTVRLAGNVIWAGEFLAIPHNAPSPAKGGGRVATVTYTYEASVMLGLAEGPCYQLAAATPGRSNQQTLDGTGKPIKAKPFAVGVWVTKKTKRALLTADKPHARFWPFNGYPAGLPNWPTGATMSDAEAGTGANNVSPDAGARFAVVQGALPPPDLGEGTGAYWSYLHNGFGPQDVLGVRKTPRQQHLVYPGLSWVAGKRIPLDSNASLPNFNFPLISGSAYFLVAGLPLPDGVEIPDPETDAVHPQAAFLDAAAHDVVRGWLTNPVWGVSGFAAYLDASAFDATKRNSFAAYVLAHDILISPLYDSQRTAADILEELATIANVALVWSEGLLKVIPYGDTAATSALTGVSYDPGSTASDPASPTLTGAYLRIRADLDDDDFLPMGEDGPVVVDRTAPDDIVNHVSIEFTNRLNAYAPEIAEAKDEAGIAASGGAVRGADITKVPAIMRVELGRAHAQRVLQDLVNRRNTYKFRLGWEHVLLEPMDVVTLTDPALGLDHLPVRIRSIIESDDGDLDISAIDVPIGVRTALSYATQATAGFAHDYNVPAGALNQPAIFEAPFTLTDGRLVLYVCASGDNNWGGAAVFFSEDGVQYRSLGAIADPAIHGAVLSGTLTAGIAAGGLDTVGALTVALFDNAALPTVSAPEADALATLCYHGRGNDYELFAYDVPTFLGADPPRARYQIGPGRLRRGVYQTTPRAARVGDQFAVLSSGITIPIDPRLIGATVYLKLIPHNVYGTGQADLTEVDPIEWRVEGRGLLTPPAALATLRTAYQDTHLVLTWDAVTDPRPLTYEIRRGAAWDNAPLVDRVTEPRLRLTGSGTYWVAARVAVETGRGPVVVYGAPVSVQITNAVLPANVLVASDQAADAWPGVLAPWPSAVWAQSFNDNALGGPLVYLRGGSAADDAGQDWSGHDLRATVGPGVTRIAGLVPGDADLAYRFNGTSDGKLVLAGYGRYLNRVGLVNQSGEGGFGWGMAWVVRRDRTGVDEILWEATDPAVLWPKGEWPQLRVTGAGRLQFRYVGAGGSATTLFETTDGAIPVSTPTLVVWNFNGASHLGYIGDSAIGGSSTVRDWRPWSGLIVGQAANGTAPFQGVLDELVVQDYPINGETITRLAAILAGSTGAAVAIDASRNAVQLAGAGSFAAVPAVDDEASWASGSTTPRGERVGYYYLPTVHPSLVALAQDGTLRLDAELTAAAYALYTSWAAAPSVADLDAVAGNLGRWADARLEMALAAGLGANREPDGARFGGWRPLVPGLYRASRAKFRLRLGSRANSVGVRATQARVTIDVDDLVQSGEVTLGSVDVQRAGGAAERYVPGDATLAIPLEQAIAVGEHVVVVVGLGGDPGPVAPTVTDDAGNTYQLDAAVAPTGSNGLLPHLRVFSAKATAALARGQVVTVRQAHAPVATAVAYRVVGLAASAWGTGLVASGQGGTGRGPAGSYALGAGSLSHTPPQLILGAFALRAQIQAADSAQGARVVAGPGLAYAGGHCSRLYPSGGVDVATLACWRAGAASPSTMAPQVVGAYAPYYLGAQVAYALAAPTTATRIRFPRRFNRPPEVSIAVTSPTAITTPDVVEVSAVTTDYFEARVLNNGVAVARAITWTAKGF